MAIDKNAEALAEGIEERMGVSDRHLRCLARQGPKRRRPGVVIVVAVALDELLRRGAARMLARASSA